MSLNNKKLNDIKEQLKQLDLKDSPLHVNASQFLSNLLDTLDSSIYKHKADAKALTWTAIQSVARSLSSPSPENVQAALSAIDKACMQLKKYGASETVYRPLEHMGAFIGAAAPALLIVASIVALGMTLPVMWPVLVSAAAIAAVVGGAMNLYAGYYAGMARESNKVADQLSSTSRTISDSSSGFFHQGDAQKNDGTNEKKEIELVESKPKI